MADVEQEAAKFFGTEDAFYFPTGYLGSSVLVKAIADTFDLVVCDEAVHYSSQDAATLSGKPIVTFRSRDPEHLNKVLQEHVGPKKVAAGEAVRPLVLVDGVFPVQGKISPVREYIEVLCKYPDSALIVDDAHALGVLGERGRGSYEHAGIDLSQVNTNKPSQLDFTSDPNSDDKTGVKNGEGPRLFVCGTMSKAFGGYGGIVFGSKEFIEHIKQTSSYFRGASALPPAAPAATAEALRMISEDSTILQRLKENTTLARDGLRKLGLTVEPTPVPVICLELDTAAEMRRVQSTLQQRGILISYNAAYSDLGPEGALRIAIFATHTPEMIQKFVEELGKVCNLT
jgi:7-keto-8-aminopelargonate synthetase-like enzyme